MIRYTADQLSAKQNYKFLTGSVIPRPIAWVTTLNPETNLVNAAPFSYFNVVSRELPLISLSINRKPNGLIKDTAQNLLLQPEAVIHLVDDSVLAKMNQTAANLPTNESELELIDHSLIDSRAIQVPAIKEAPIRFETRVHHYLPLKKEEQIITDFFILEVLEYYFKEDIFDSAKEYIIPEKFSPLARLAGNTYSHIDHFVDLKRPD